MMQLPRMNFMAFAFVVVLLVTPACVGGGGGTGDGGPGATVDGGPDGSSGPLVCLALKESYSTCIGFGSEWDDPEWVCSSGPDDIAACRDHFEGDSDVVGECRFTDIFNYHQMRSGTCDDVLALVSADPCDGDCQFVAGSATECTCRGDNPCGFSDDERAELECGPEYGQMTCEEAGITTQFGVCDHGTMAFCADPTDLDSSVTTFACDHAEGRLDEGGSDGVCVVIDEVGAICAFQEGEACYLNLGDATFDQTWPFPCVDEHGDPINTMGCDAFDGCLSGLPACSTPAELTCIGDRSAAGCNAYGQWELVDCKDIGGTGCSGSGVCVGIAAGYVCAASATCAPGLTCQDIDDEGYGTCG
jgi:hypothetical protein